MFVVIFISFSSFFYYYCCCCYLIYISKQLLWETKTFFTALFDSIVFFETWTENVIQDWNTDYMFGYQFLNGCNPVMISKCVELPDNFPVTHEMVEGSLQRCITLEEELKVRNMNT